MYSALFLAQAALLGQVPSGCTTGTGDLSYSQLDISCYVGPLFGCPQVFRDRSAVAASQVAFRDASWYQVVLRNMALKESESVSRRASAWTSATAVFVGGYSFGGGWGVTSPGALTANSACNTHGTGQFARASSIASRGCSILTGISCTSGGEFFGDPIMNHGPQNFDGEGHAAALATDASGVGTASAVLPDDDVADQAMAGAILETHTIAGDFKEGFGYEEDGYYGSQCEDPGAYSIRHAHNSAKRNYGSASAEVSGSGLARIPAAPENQECGVIVRMFVDDQAQNSVVLPLSYIQSSIDLTIPARSTFDYLNDSQPSRYNCQSTASGSGEPAVGSWRLTRLYRTVTNASGVPSTQLWHRLSVTRAATGEQIAWHYGTTFAPEAIPADTVVETFLPTGCDSNFPVSFRISTTEGTLDAGSQSCLLLPAELDLDAATSTSSSIRVDFEDRLKFAEAYGTSLGAGSFNPDADYVPDGQIALSDWQAFNVCYRAHATGCFGDIAGANQSSHPDGLLTADDIIVFLGWYFAGNLAADYSGPDQSIVVDGQLTADDIIVYLNAFFQSCP